MSCREEPEVTRLVGVYDADGTLMGELSYFVRARVGRAHCALCDITHGHVRQRPEWKSAKARLPVSFDTFHRDDQPANVQLATDGRVPVVVAETDHGVMVLLGPEQIAACGGSVDALVVAVERGAAEQHLRWPAPVGGARPR